MKVQAGIADLLQNSTNKGITAGMLKDLGKSTQAAGTVEAAVQMLLAQIETFFGVIIDSLWPLPFLFLPLSFYDHIRDSLSSFHCLAMKRMPLGGDKPLLQGMKTTTSF